MSEIEKKILTSLNSCITELESFKSDLDSNDVNTFFLNVYLIDTIRDLNRNKEKLIRNL